MPEYIRDPEKNNAARVTSKAQILTRSTSVSLEATAAEDGLAYDFGPDAQAAKVPLTASFDGFFAAMRNRDPRVLRIQKVGFDADIAGIQVYAERNPTVGTIANAVDGYAINLNFDSNNEADVDLWVWDTTSTGIGGLTPLANNRMPSSYLPAFTPIVSDVLGSIVLGPGDVLAIGALSVATAQLLGFSVRFFFEEPLFS
ncbi:MAG: hypothetical protein GY906_30185 [bacterium]|nr:hypothetical protein [bacterium]